MLSHFQQQQQQQHFFEAFLSPATDPHSIWIAFQVHLIPQEFPECAAPSFKRKDSVATENEALETGLESNSA